MKNHHQLRSFCPLLFSAFQQAKKSKRREPKPRSSLPFLQELPLTMALSFGRKKLRGESGGHGSRCRHFHVHYHLPRKRASNFSPLRWLPRLSLLSCVLIPLALFFAVLAFVVSFVWFTLLYFVASLLKKDSNHESNKSGSFGRARGDVDNHLREGGGAKGKRQAKGKALKHAKELLTGDSSTAVRKPEIKEVHDCSLSSEVRTNDDRVVENLTIFEISTEGMLANADLEGFSSIDEVQGVPVDGFGDEHNIRVVSSSTSGDSLPTVYPINSAQIHDVPDMNEVIEMSPVRLIGRNQNMVEPSNTSPHPNISDAHEEYGQELFEDRKGLSDYTPYEIIDFIDKHETRDQALDGSFAEDEKIGLQLSFAEDGSAHVRISDEHDKDSMAEEDSECLPEFLVDSVGTLEDYDEQSVPEIPITEADTEQSVAASNEVHDFSNGDETSGLPLHSVCEDKDSSDASTDHYNGYEDDKQVETIDNKLTEASDPASVACDFAENHQTATRANDDSVNGGSTAEVVSRESSEVEADKVNDNSISKGAPRGRPLLRRSPSQWWNLCGVVDVFAGSAD